MIHQTKFRLLTQPSRPLPSPHCFWPNEVGNLPLYPTFFLLWFCSHTPSSGVFFLSSHVSLSVPQSQ